MTKIVKSGLFDRFFSLCMAVLSQRTISQATPYQQPARLPRSQVRSFQSPTSSGHSKTSAENTLHLWPLYSGLKSVTLRRQVKEKLHWLELFSPEPEEEVPSHTWLPWCSRRSRVSPNTATHLYKELCGGLCKHLQCFPRCVSKLLNSLSGMSKTPSCVTYLCYYILPNGRVVLCSFLCLPLKFYHIHMIFIRVKAKRKLWNGNSHLAVMTIALIALSFGKRLTEGF